MIFNNYSSKVCLYSTLSSLQPIEFVVVVVVVVVVVDVGSTETKTTGPATVGSTNNKNVWTSGLSLMSPPRAELAKGRARAFQIESGLTVSLSIWTIGLVLSQKIFSISLFPSVEGQSWFWDREKPAYLFSGSFSTQAWNLTPGLWARGLSHSTSRVSLLPPKLSFNLLVLPWF